MQGKQLAAYAGGLTVFLACLGVGYGVLFPSPSADSQESTVGLANGFPYRSTDWPPDASKAAVPFYDEMVELVLAPWNEAPDEDDASAEPGTEQPRTAGQGTNSGLPVSTNANSEAQSPLPAGAKIASPQLRRGIEALQTHDEAPERHDEASAERYGQWHQRRLSRRGDDSVDQGRSRDDVSRARANPNQVSVARSQRDRVSHHQSARKEHDERRSGSGSGLFGSLFWP